MAIDPFSLAATGISLGLGLLSGGGAAADARKARAAEQKRIENQYKADTANYEFNWETTQRQYKFAKNEVSTARANQEANLTYQEASQARDYAHTLAIRNFEYANQVRAYNKSEQVYGDQRRLNRLASQDALANESRRYNEILKGMSFEHQDMLVKMMKEQGVVEAKGGQGISAGRLSGETMAQYGRNQAIMAANVISAQRESLQNEKQIYSDRYAADVAADAKRMLQPLLAPTPTAPLKMPRPVLLDPLEPRKGPAPIKGTNTVSTPSGLTIASNAIGTAVNSYSTVHTGLKSIFG